MGATNSSKKFRITNCNQAGEARAKLLTKYKISHGVIGRGAFGKVYKGSSLSNSKNKVAIKVFKNKQLFEDDIKAIEAEIKVLSQLDHPNIVKYYESFADEGGMYIVTELIKGETLSQKIEKECTGFNDSDAAKIVHQLASALNHCHSKNIIHRDIKPDNVIIDDRLNVTLLDFGLSKNFSMKKALKSAAGTPTYMAPECMLRDYNEKVDVWSLGVLMYVLLTGKLPFTGNLPSKILKKALKCNLGLRKFKNISAEAKNLLESIITPNAKKRLSIKEVLAHEWFDILKDDTTDDSFDESEISVLKTLTNFSNEAKFTKACMKLLTANIKIK
mmetsp:Transcript_9997/g.11360  ORF Transcript_9997/g.11360 Transcript_9997/m.11360 type:complete len:331 (-) Transcript_9997:490-1482(-)